MTELAIQGLIAAAEGIYRSVRGAIEASQMEEAKKQAYLDQLTERISRKEAALDAMEDLRGR